MAKKSSDNPTTVVGDSSATNSDRLSLLKARLAVAKAFCKKPHAAWKKWIEEYEIEDVSDTEEIRDRVRIGYIFRRVESDLPAIFDDQPDLFFKGKKEAIRVLEPLFESTYDWLWDTQRLEETVEDTATYFLLLGMGFVKSPWVTKNKTVTQTESVPVMDENGQQIGEKPQETKYQVPIIDNPQASSQDPFKIYFSPETKFAPVLDHEHCPYYFTEEATDPAEIKSLYGKDVDTTEVMNLTELEIDSSVSKLTQYKDDIKRTTRFEYYGSLPEENAKGIKDENGNSVEWAYDQEYHIVFTKNEELKVEACPYIAKPTLVLGNYGLANKFFKFGDAKHLMPLVQELQQYRTQILKHTRKIANPKPLIPMDAEVDEKAFSDPNVGATVKYQPGASGLKPEYLSPAGLGQEVEVGVGLVRTDLEQTSGSFNLAQGSGVSTVKTPRGIQTFSEAADKNVRRKRKKVARFIRELILFQFQQLAQNWKPEDERTLDVVNDGVTESVPVTAEVLQVLGDPNILAKLDIETESLSVNKVQMKQDALDLLDLALQHPEVFNLTEIAKDALQNGFGKKDADRYLVSDQQRQAMAQPQPEPPKVSVQIKADATTPPGASLLENEGLLQPGQGTQAVVDNQVMEQQQTDNQTNQQMQTNQINSALNQPNEVSQGGQPNASGQ